ncbi:MAG: DUF1152 domain-containing protein [Candidatus Hermodarchaeia archaeon]|jgi:hypothetical protein
MTKFSKLNIPSLELGSKILIAGAGGGFDVYAGLPLAYEWMMNPPTAEIADFQIVLANYYDKVHADFVYRPTEPEDYPLGNYSSRYVKDMYGVAHQCYTIGRHGVQLVREAYQEIVDKHNIDTIILIDGGVDALMRGDEANSGTILEDFISLLALGKVFVPNRYVVCLGFGCETEEKLNHYRVLENISTHCKVGDFLGSCAMTRNMKCFAYYKERCLEAWNDGRKSHTHTRIIPSVMGEFGNFQMYDDIDARIFGETVNATEAFISPLQSIYWWFSLEGVARANHYREILEPSRTFVDAKMMLKNTLPSVKFRSKEVLPL